MKTLLKVATGMALHALAYNFTRVLNIVGVKPIMAAVGVTRPDFRGSGRGWSATLRGAASGCVADESEKYCSQTSQSFAARQSRPVKDPASAFSHGQDPLRTFCTTDRRSSNK